MSNPATYDDGVRVGLAIGLVLGTAGVALAALYAGVEAIRRLLVR